MDFSPIEPYFLILCDHKTSLYDSYMYHALLSPLHRSNFLYSLVHAWWSAARWDNAMLIGHTIRTIGSEGTWPRWKGVCIWSWRFGSWPSCGIEFLPDLSRKRRRSETFQLEHVRISSHHTKHLRDSWLRRTWRAPIHCDGFLKGQTLKQLIDGKPIGNWSAVDLGTADCRCVRWCTQRRDYSSRYQTCEHFL